MASIFDKNRMNVTPAQVDWIRHELRDCEIRRIETTVRVERQQAEAFCRSIYGEEWTIETTNSGADDRIVFLCRYAAERLHVQLWGPSYVSVKMFNPGGFEVPIKRL